MTIYRVFFAYKTVDNAVPFRTADIAFNFLDDVPLHTAGVN